MRIARALTVGALLAALALAAVTLFGSGDAKNYRLLFENGGQLVKGNEVLVAGQPIGTVEEINLTDEGQAEVVISTEETLHEGTTAMIRATSLSGVANRYVSIHPGPNSSEELPEGSVLTADKTTSPVDLDQLFNTLDGRTRTALQDVFKGSASIYSGNTQAARETYKFLAPGLQSTERLLAELARDQRAFTEFLVNGSDLLGAVAERRDDLSQLTENANRALGAIAVQNEALDRTLVAFPPAMRQANTTFVNLRAALDDLDPLVATSKPATRDLPEFLRDLRPVASNAVPVIGDLRSTVALPGASNDLTDMLRELPGVRKRADVALANGTDAMDDAEPTIADFRAYSPDILGLITKFGQVTSFYDANGHYARVSPTAANLFEWDGTDGVDDDGDGNLQDLVAIPPAQQFDDIEFRISQRCPGGATQPNAGWLPTGPANDHPWLADGELAGDCDPDDVPPGP